MEVSDARRLKALEVESPKLEKLLAEQMLDDAILKDVVAKMATPEARRIARGYASKEYGVSQRLACNARGVDRSSIRYASVRPDDGDLRIVMTKVASERLRFGY